MSRVYVYALVAEPISRGRQADGAIRLLTFGDIQAAVVRRSASPALSEKALKAQHEIVARLARRFDAILPARFGALVDVSELGRVIELRRGVLVKALANVRGREQMTVRFFNRGSVSQNANQRGSLSRNADQRGSPLHDADQPELIHETPDEVASATGTSYLERRREMHRVALSAVAERVRRSVGPMVFAETVDPGRGRLGAVLHHLIPRGRSREYRELVLKAVAEVASEESIAVSGPFAPFAFAPEIWS